MELFIDITIYLFIPGVIGMFLLTTLIHWASFISDIKPDSAIKLNMKNAIFAYNVGKIEKHKFYNEFYTADYIVEVPIYMSYFTYVYLLILDFIRRKSKPSSKINEFTTNRFLNELYNREKGEE